MAKINRSYLRWLMLMGLVEGISTIVLLGVAMPLKYAAGQPLAVTIVGSLHGLLFVALWVMVVIGRFVIPLTNRLMIWALLGAIVPFGPFIVDVWLRQLDQPSIESQDAP
mgnify:CR=1 FL=1